MQKYSVFSLIKNALKGHKDWEVAWKDPTPKSEYDVIIIGGGGHGLATAYYLAKEHNITTVSDKEIRDGNGPKLLKDITSTFDSIYLSIDLDVLDPAFAPGVGNPEAVGISSRELYDLVTTLQNKKIVCADIVELNPTYDNGATASMAAKMISTIIAMNLSRSNWC